MHTPDPSKWLLTGEPDLTTDQVWAVLATAGQGGIKVLRDGVVIADTADQVRQKLLRMEWTPIHIINETALNAQITKVENASVVRRYIWAATTAFLQLLVVPSIPDRSPFAGLVALRDKVRAVRLQRGNSTMGDARSFKEERFYALTAQQLPGGQAQFDAEVEAILDMDRRTPRPAGTTPPDLSKSLAEIEAGIQRLK